MTSETLKWWLDKMLGVADVLAKFTPTDVDNKIVAFAKSIAENPDLLEVLVVLINLFNSKKMGDEHAKVTVADLLTALKKHGHMPTE